MQRMKNQIEQLQAELLYVKGDYSTSFEELQILKQKISLLETSNAELQNQLREHQVNFERLTKQAIEAQVQLQQKIEQETEQLRLWKASWEREVLQALVFARIMVFLGEVFTHRRRVKIHISR